MSKIRFMFHLLTELDQYLYFYDRLDIKIFLLNFVWNEMFQKVP